MFCFCFFNLPIPVKRTTFVCLKFSEAHHRLHLSEIQQLVSYLLRVLEPHGATLCLVLEFWSSNVKKKREREREFQVSSRSSHDQNSHENRKCLFWCLGETEFQCLTFWFVLECIKANLLAGFSWMGRFCHVWKRCAVCWCNKFNFLFSSHEMSHIPSLGVQYNINWVFGSSLRACTSSIQMFIQSMFSKLMFLLPNSKIPYSNKCKPLRLFKILRINK